MRGLQKNKKKGKNMVRVEAKWKKKGEKSDSQGYFKLCTYGCII